MEEDAPGQSLKTKDAVARAIVQIKMIDFHVGIFNEGIARGAGVLSEGARLASGASSAQGHTRWPCTKPGRYDCCDASTLLNNVIEKNHRAIKRRSASMKGFRSLPLRQLRLLAANSLIASISINFHSDEAVRVIGIAHRPRCRGNDRSASRCRSCSDSDRQPCRRCPP